MTPTVSAPSNMPPLMRHTIESIGIGIGPFTNGTRVSAVNMRQELHEFTRLPKPKKANFVKRVLRLVGKLQAAPKGDQGGWEGGARGL